MNPLRNSVTLLVSKIFKVNGYTFRGSNSAISTFESHLNGGLPLKKIYCSEDSLVRANSSFYSILTWKPVKGL